MTAAVKPRIGMRTLAGALLGLTLGAGLGGLYVVLGPQAASDNLIVSMMALFPLWIAAWTCAYIPATALRAWAWLLAGNAVAYAALWIAKSATGWGT